MADSGFVVPRWWCDGCFTEISIPDRVMEYSVSRSGLMFCSCGHVFCRRSCCTSFSDPNSFPCPLCQISVRADPVPDLFRCPQHLHSTFRGGPEYTLYLQQCRLFEIRFKYEQARHVQFEMSDSSAYMSLIKNEPPQAPRFFASSPAPTPQFQPQRESHFGFGSLVAPSGTPFTSSDVHQTFPSRSSNLGAPHGRFLLAASSPAPTPFVDRSFLPTFTPHIVTPSIPHECMDETGNVPDTKPAPTARLAPKSKPASKTPTATKEYDFDRFKAAGKKVPKRTAPKQTRGNVSAIIAKSATETPAVSALQERAPKRRKVTETESKEVSMPDLSDIIPAGTSLKPSFMHLIPPPQPRGSNRADSMDDDPVEKVPQSPTLPMSQHAAAPPTIQCHPKSSGFGFAAPQSWNLDIHEDNNVLSDFENEFQSFNGNFSCAEE